ncbi:hypothetical protein PLESTB_000319800 [Pleodorina starrii]|uniref:Uncharacterized protein n=1 Tax=Pleodorina starrii TaxID=330485 RepID=A0A9W6EYU1_9CHLO|nr:hypothetical protein PLESTB_000319800 [Pleodorina starrii]
MTVSLACRTAVATPTGGVFTLASSSASAPAKEPAAAELDVERLSSTEALLHYILELPYALNHTFDVAPELRHRGFWEVFRAAQALALISSTDSPGGLPDAASRISDATDGDENSDNYNPDDNSADPDRGQPDGNPAAGPDTDVDVDADLTPQLDAMARQIAALPTHLCWPVLRRVVLAALARRRLLRSRPLSAAEQAAGGRLAGELFAAHRRAAGRKGILDFFHVSKAGGTSFCQLAKLNGCRTESFTAAGNCLMRGFDDWPRWVNRSLHVSLAAPRSLNTPWFANYGIRKPRNYVPCGARKRTLLREGYTVVANEFATHGGARSLRGAHLCPGHVNVLQLRHPYTRLRSHLLWVKSLYEQQYGEAAAAFLTPPTEPLERGSEAPTDSGGDEPPSNRRGSEAPAEEDGGDEPPSRRLAEAVGSPSATHGSAAAHWQALLPAATDNYYIRSLLGEAVYYLPRENLTRRHLAAARLALTQIDVLLLLEQPRANEVMFEMALGWGLGFGAVHARKGAASGGGSQAPLPSPPPPPPQQQSQQQESEQRQLQEQQQRQQRQQQAGGALKLGPEDWLVLLRRNELDMELYRFGSALVQLDAIVFEVARQAGLGSGYTAVEAAGGSGGGGSRSGGGKGGSRRRAKAVVDTGQQQQQQGHQVVSTGLDEQWELSGAKRAAAGNCGFVSAHDADDVLPTWLVL